MEPKAAPESGSRKPTGNAAGATIVPTELLADVLNPLVDRLEIEVAADKPRLRKGGGHWFHGAGSLSLIASRTAEDLGIDERSILRKLWDIRNRVGRQTDLHFADVVLLRGFGLNFADYDLPVLPLATTGAREMVDAYHDAKEIEITPKEAKQLALSLYHFGRGFLDGLHDGQPARPARAAT